MRKLLVWISKTYGNPEIIITENGSTDDSDLYDSQRISYHRVNIYFYLHYDRCTFLNSCFFQMVVFYRCLFYTACSSSYTWSRIFSLTLYFICSVIILDTRLPYDDSIVCSLTTFRCGFKAFSRILLPFR